MGGITDKSRPRGKLSQSDYDDVFAKSADKCLYCLTRQQADFLLSIVYMGRWKTRWFSDLDTPIDTDLLDAFISDLELSLMTDNCGIADQITALQECCANLQYQLTQIEGQMCVSQDMAMNFYRQNLVNQGQAPFPDTTFSSDTNLPDQTGLYATANGLCQAIYRYIKSILADYLTKAEVSVAIIAGGAALINPILGAIAGTVGGLLLADLIDSAGDQTAIDDVACCMYTALRDKAVTFENFFSCLADCGFSAPDHNATIAGVIGGSVHDYANYVAFVSVLKTETNKALAESPTAYPVCGSCTCGDTIDFTLGQRGDWEIYMGTMDGVEGIKSVDNTDNAFSSHHTSVRLVRHFDPPCPHINSVDIYYKQSSNAEGRTTTGANTIYYALETLDPTSCPLDFQANTGTGGTMTQDNAEHFIHWTLNEDNVKCIQMWDHLDVWLYHIRKIVINP